MTTETQQATTETFLQALGAGQVTTSEVMQPVEALPATVKSAVSGFEAFEEINGGLSEDSIRVDVKDTSAFKVFFRKPDGKRKKLKGSTDACALVSYVMADLGVHNVAAAGTDVADEAPAPKKRGPKPKSQTGVKVKGATSDNNNVTVVFVDDAGHVSRDFLSSLRNAEPFEIDLHVLGSEDQDLEVFTFENCVLVPSNRFVTFSKDLGGDGSNDLVSVNPLQFTEVFSYSRVTRSVG